MTPPSRALLAAAALFAALSLRPVLAAPAAPRCEPLAAALTRTLHPGALLLLGELHGSAESPKVAERFVCHALQRGHAVALFLEVPDDEQPRIDTYLQSDGGVDAQRMLVNGSAFWDAPADQQDGRRSVALLGLIDAVRRLRQAGVPLSLVAFDAARDFEQRDRTMAERVRAWHARRPADVLITYTGNIHNMLELPSDMPAGLPPPMGSHLADLRPVALSLAPVAGGALWNCSPACGVHRLAPVSPQRRREGRRLVPRSFTDVVPLGPVSPSIPAAARLARAAQ